MSGITSYHVETREEKQLNSMVAFLDMFSVLQKYADNPKLLDGVKQKIAEAYAIRDDQKKALADLEAQAERARAIILESGKAKAELDRLHDDHLATHAANKAALESAQADNEEEFKRRVAFLDGRRDALAKDVEALEVERSLFNKDSAELARKIAELEARESAVKEREEKIASVKAALGLQA